jgi:hypothetical protein
MQNSTGLPFFSLRLSCTISLPCVNREPGPLHTILRDEKGNLYYSDEINHSLVSLNGAGELRWHKSKQGKNAGEFKYPKGIELGWVCENGAHARCLAVCDSWNRRVQFFDRDGSFLTSWDKVGEESLKDVVDIRFIGAADGSKSELSYWLILDRGHHSLFGVDISGELIFRIGRAFPDNLESHWPLPSDSTELQASPFALLQNCLPHDPLFMPSRILGNTEDALFIYEPKSKRLKQAASGNILPLWMEPPGNAEWIAADARGLYCFDRDAGLIWSYDGIAKAWQSAPIQGAPIPSSQSTKELWSQEGSLLRHWICRNENDSAGPWILYSLLDEIAAAMQSGAALAEEKNLQEAAANLRDLSKRVLKTTLEQWSDSVFVEEARKSLASSIRTLTTALSGLKMMSRASFLGLLKIHTLQTIHAAAEDRLYFRQAVSLINTAIKPIESLFEEMLLFRDEWLRARLAQAASWKADPAGVQETLLHEYYDTLLQVVQELAKWLWSIPFSDAINNAPKSSGTKNSLERSHRGVECFSLNRQSPSKYLREIDRIFVGDVARAGCVSPAAICHGPQIGFLVSLNSSGQVLRLSEQGQVVGAITLASAPGSILGQPHGVAVDDANRIWISRPQRNCIEILDVDTNQRQSLEDLAGRMLGLKYPTGIYRAFNGWMLIADTQNSRILAAAPSGQITPLVDREGKNPGELLHPIAFCSTNEKSEFWVVEIRNHRLQRFGLNGQSMETVGRVGLGKGHLLLPESATIFDDGTLAVSQRACTREIKLFSKDGEELETLHLDYAPWGILAHKNLLFVCEGFGNHIHVYERA